MTKLQTTIILRPEVENDMEFLFGLYASTRADEKELVSWNDEHWDDFLRMQFDLQHTQYRQNYRNASFDIILLNDTSAGRLYVQRGNAELHIIDISILPKFRGCGLGGRLLGELIHEAEDMRLPVTLHVEKNNRALHLYQRLGFVVEADRGVQWFMVYQPARKSALLGILRGEGGDAEEVEMVM